MSNDNDYVRPSSTALEIRKTAQMIVYFAEVSDNKDLSPIVKDIAAGYVTYGNQEQLQSLEECLYDLCYNTEKFPEVAGRVLYDGRNPMARRVAEWWQDHIKPEHKAEFDPDLLRKETIAALRKLGSLSAKPGMAELVNKAAESSNLSTSDLSATNGMLTAAFATLDDDKYSAALQDALVNSWAERHHVDSLRDALKLHLQLK